MTDKILPSGDAAPIPALPLDLEPIKAREAAAAPAPWMVDDVDGDGNPPWILRDRRKFALAELVANTATHDFIAHARTDIPALLAEVERLRDEIADAREACPSIRMQDHCDASLLELVNLEVSRGFNRDAEIARLRLLVPSSQPETVPRGEMIGEGGRSVETVKAIWQFTRRLTDAESDALRSYIIRQGGGILCDGSDSEKPAPSSQPETPTETTLRAALRRIADGGDCQCEDHASKDCCAAVEDFCCPLCIAERALMALPAVQDEALKPADMKERELERENLIDMLQSVEWVRQSAGSKYACPFCHCIADRDDGPGHAEDCRWLKAMSAGPSPAPKETK